MLMMVCWHKGRACASPQRQRRKIVLISCNPFEPPSQPAQAVQDYCTLSRDWPGIKFQEVGPRKKIHKKRKKKKRLAEADSSEFAQNTVLDLNLDMVLEFKTLLLPLAGQILVNRPSLIRIHRGVVCVFKSQNSTLFFSIQKKAACKLEEMGDIEYGSATSRRSRVWMDEGNAVLSD